MGTQNQCLTTPQAWGQQAVQAHSACNLEAHTVLAQAQLHLPEGIPETSLPGAHGRMWPWQPKSDHYRHRPLGPQLSPSERPAGALLWVRRWSLLGPNTNPTPKRDPPLKPKPASNPNPGGEPPSGMGPHFSPRGRSRDRSRFGPGDVPGPNPNPS